MVCSHRMSYIWKACAKQSDCATPRAATQAPRQGSDLNEQSLPTSPSTSPSPSPSHNTTHQTNHSHIIHKNNISFQHVLRRHLPRPLSHPLPPNSRFVITIRPSSHSPHVHVSPPCPSPTPSLAHPPPSLTPLSSLDQIRHLHRRLPNQHPPLHPRLPPRFAARLVHHQRVPRGRRI